MNQYQTPVLNGDLNILGIKDGMPCVYGLPWCGTSEIYTTTTYPLGGIVFLKQAPFNRVDFLSLDEQALCLVQEDDGYYFSADSWFTIGILGLHFTLGLLFRQL